MSIFPELYNSAMLAGDIENALFARWNCCGYGFWTTIEDLQSVSKHIALLIREAVGAAQFVVLSCSFSLPHIHVDTADTHRPKEKVSAKHRSPLLHGIFQYLPFLVRRAQPGYRIKEL